MKPDALALRLPTDRPRELPPFFHVRDTAVVRDNDAPNEVER